MIWVKRDDGEILEVSQKVFDLSLKSRGFEELKTLKIVNAAGDNFIEIDARDFDKDKMFLWNDKIEPKGFKAKK